MRWLRSPEPIKVRRLASRLGDLAAHDVVVDAGDEDAAGLGPVLVWLFSSRMETVMRWAGARA